MPVSRRHLIGCALPEKETRLAQQRLIEGDQDESEKILSVWHGRVAQLVLCPNANHCIRTALSCSCIEHIQFIIYELQVCADTILFLIMHKYACRAFVAMVKRFGGTSEICSGVIQCIDQNFEKIAASNYGCHVVAAFFIHHGSSEKASNYHSQLLYFLKREGRLQFTKKWKLNPLLTVCFAAAQSGYLWERNEIVVFLQDFNDWAIAMGKDRYMISPKRLLFLKSEYEKDSIQLQSEQTLVNFQDMEGDPHHTSMEVLPNSQHLEDHYPLCAPIIYQMVWVPAWSFV
jgi:hypothetical protein